MRPEELPKTVRRPLILGEMIPREIPSAPQASAERRRAVLRVFLVCWLLYTVFWAPYILREHYPAITLAEQGH